MNAFVTHSSVRVKGTENNYDPVVCQSADPECADKPLHMHCPFCVTTESFTDPVILRAHYRVKHVDKGIEFAGLKMLRCCDHCDIIGTIKGMKEFKGAHWHCYKCRNGFNRRDEALKHYRTHFRNPMTTFQIQVAQEVNSANVDHSSEDRVMTTETISADDLVTIHPALTEAVMTSSPADTLAANETVGTTEGSTIMIIQEDQLDRNSSVERVLSISPVEHSSHADIESHINNLEASCKHLEHEKQKMEEEFINEITHLKQKVETQEEEIIRLQKREQELLEQLSVPLDDRIQELLVSLKSQHEDLLHQQLAQLRRTYIQSAAANSYFVISKPDAELADYSEHGLVVIPNVTNDNSHSVMTESDSVIGSVDSASRPAEHFIEVDELATKQLTDAKAASPTNPAESDDNLPDNSSLDIEMVVHSHSDIMDTQDHGNSEMEDSSIGSPPAKQQKT